MKILIVAQSESIHTVRWINQITDMGWDIHLYDSTDSGYINPLLRKTTVYHSMYGKQPELDTSVQRKGMWLPTGRTYAKLFLQRWLPAYGARRLAQLIQSLQPDLICSLEFQHSAYLVLEARQYLESQGVKPFPRWVVYNWGSDIYLFNRLPEHQPRIAELLQKADYYGCECQRDVELAQAIGMNAIPLPVLPNAGGLDIETTTQLRQKEKTSERRIIALKGYQGWAGRALFGLRALEMCADQLRGYKIVLFSAIPLEDMQIAAAVFSQKTGIPVEILPPNQPHQVILEWLARSRIYIGLSISDAISTSMLDAISVGAFPIQSNTSCADEWLINGETGFITPPEDPQAVADAIRRALTDDALVDQAAERNAQVCADRLDAAKIRQQVIEMYQAIAEHKL